MPRIFQTSGTATGDALHFSLPAGKKGTCVGASLSCEDYCNMNRWGNSGYPTVKAARRRALELTKRAEFVTWAIAELRASPQKRVRIHESGDFYSIAYIRKWIKIIKACPDKKFWCYTRSWRVKEMLPALRELAALPNLSLFWSTDFETHQADGPPPHVPCVRVAYYKEFPKSFVPSYVDVLWNDRHASAKSPAKSPAKSSPEVVSCPRGAARVIAATGGQGEKRKCDRCKECIERKPSRRDKESKEKQHAA